MSKPHLLLAVLLLASATLAAGPSGGQEHEHGGRPPFGDAEFWSGVWDDPARREWQRPVQVLEWLGVRRGEMVADLGAGTGYFTGLLSLSVGDEGRVYAVELEQSLLDHIVERRDARRATIVPVLAEPDDPKLPPGEIDLILTVNTWHHIAKRTKYLKRLAKSLSPAGRMVLIDYREGDLPVGPSADHKLDRATVLAEFDKAGWTLVAESRMLPYQYVFTFHPPRRR